jgi:hypothetical protein
MHNASYAIVFKCSLPKINCALKGKIMFEISESELAVTAQQLLSMSLCTKEGHFTHIQITEMYIAIFKKLKEELMDSEDSVADDSDE